MTARLASTLPLVLFLSAACGDDEVPAGPDADVDRPDAAAPSTDGGGELPVPETYAFASRFTPGASSVVYTGQSFRHLLITDLNAYIGGLTAAIDTGALAPADGDTLAALNFYYEFDASTGGQVTLLLATDPAPLQAVYDDLVAGGPNLKGKVAGAEAAYDHVVWATDFAGWSEGGPTTPDGLVQRWLGQLDDLARDRALGIIPTGPDGAAIGKVHVTAQGQDLQQLVQKFLLMSTGYSQAADKYLDSATEGAGLLLSNAQDGDKPYSKLEHAWDEGFGYFGAARAYKLRSDQDNASPGYHDADGDGRIDLRAELNFGASQNAVKRDLGSAAEAPTDFSGTAIDAFLRGRALIAASPDTLDADQLAALEAERDRAVGAWEDAIAATCVHYINEVLADMEDFGTDGYSFLDHAKHWSELKGFALGLQFNPRARLSQAQFAELHALLGDAPVLADAGAEDVAAYQQALVEARGLFKAAYGFADANLTGW